MTVFDLILVPFPFTDLSTTKQRPCMVPSVFQPTGLSEHRVVAMVTSQLSGVALPGDFRFAKWREAGLPKPSLVRLAKIVTLDRSIVRKKLGAVQATDRQAIQRKFREVFREIV